MLEQFSQRLVVEEDDRSNILQGYYWVQLMIDSALRAVIHSGGPRRQRDASRKVRIRPLSGPEDSLAAGAAGAAGRARRVSFIIRYLGKLQVVEPASCSMPWRLRMSEASGRPSPR